MLYGMREEEEQELASAGWGDERKKRVDRTWAPGPGSDSSQIVGVAKSRVKRRIWE